MIKVIGISIATPFTEPRPGIAPTNKPIRQPNIKRPRFKGSKDTKIPSRRSINTSIFYVFTFPISLRIHKIVYWIK